MLPFDRSRFLFSLAESLRSAQWTKTKLQAAFRQATTERSMKVRGFVGRLLAAFPTPPAYAHVLAFLASDTGLLRALNRLSQYPPRIDIRLVRRPVMGQPPAKLSAIKIPAIVTEAALAEWLVIEPGRLRWYADLGGRNRKHAPGPLRTYRHRWVPKVGGKARLLEIPRRELKRLQRKILEDILNHVPPHAAAHGFRPAHSALTNATAHCGRAVVIGFDLTDFFPSIPAARVYRTFRTIGYPETVARLLTGLCTTRLPADVWDSRPNPGSDGSDHSVRLRLSERHLPQGAPTSPALANLAACRLDRRLSGLAFRLDATFTRYADDLTFSGGLDLGRRAKRLAVLVAVIAADEGFTLNYRKTRIMNRCGRQTVTGVVVNQHPNLPRAKFDRLKAILTNCVRHGTASQNRGKCSDFRAHLMGKVAHAAAIHPARGRKLWALFDKITWPVVSADH